MYIFILCCSDEGLNGTVVNQANWALKGPENEYIQSLKSNSLHYNGQF